MITAAVMTLMAVVVFIIISLCGRYPGVGWREKDIEQNGRVIRLKNKRVIIEVNGKTTWMSSKDYKVEDLLMSDIDGDGKEELTLLLWKKGKYGQSKPLWEKDKEEDKSWSQHIFIYEVNEKDEAVSKWFASDLGMQV